MADDLDPIALLSPLRTGLKLVRILQRWTEGPERASIYRDHYEEWVAELAQRLRERAERDEALAERLDTLEQDRERVLVLGNLGFEAWREAVDRRRAMLGDAAEAAIFSELSATELARIERTIRLLDPEDLEALARVAMADKPLSAFARLENGHLGGAALVAAGCVQVYAVTGYGGGRASSDAEVTPLGALVLRFMGRARSDMPTEPPNAGARGTGEDR